MNKHLHRIIFNKARGILMAVAECASSHSRGDARSRIEGDTETAASWLLKPVALSVLLVASGSMGFIPYAKAQVVVDPGAAKSQQPTILNAANGVPLINIQTPSAAGVSRNTYSQFDVQANGVILNNARTNAQTQLGGWVQDNPSLATGTARVILNEVNSNAPSQLRGYIEVGGDRAQVVVANPAGITCDGCGFINANRATLTTGTPIMNGGNLDGFRVERGQIVIQGNGLDATQVDYTDLIARSIQVNAGIWANTLKLTAGANQVAVDNSQASPIAGTGSAPAFAIDVAQLGGMYAGKITLVGSETGVGVRNAGHLGASAGEVSISLDGLLGNSGSINSSGAMQIDTRNGIVNSGTLYAQGDSTLTTRGDIANSGLIAAQGNSTLTATGANSRIDSAAASIIAAGIQPDGSPGSSGNLVIGATQAVVANGQNLSGGDLSIAAGTIDLRNSQNQSRNMMLSAARGDLDLRSASLNASGALQASASQTLRHDQAQTMADQITLVAHEISNRGGQLVQTGTAVATVSAVGALDNTGGLIASNHDLAIAAGSLNNSSGSIGSAGKLTLTGGTLDNTAGQIQAVGDAMITLAGQLDNQAGLLRSGGTLDIAAGRIDNSQSKGANQGIEGHAVAIRTGAATLNNQQGAIRADSTLAVSGSGTLDNSQGLISAGDALTIRNSQAMPTLSIINAGGQLLAANTLTLNADRLSGAGQLLSLGDLSLGLVQSFTQAGSIQAGHNATLSLQGQLGNSGLIAAGNQVAISAVAIDNQGTGEISAGTTRLAATGSLTNRGLIDGTETALDAAVVNNLGSGRIYGDHIGITAGTLNNTNENAFSPTIAARNRLDLGIGALNNDNGALIFSAGDMAVGGALDGNRQATGSAGAITNNGGTIQALGDLAIKAGQIANSNANFSAVAVTSGNTVTQTTYFTSQGTFTEDQIATKYDTGVWGKQFSFAGDPNPAANSTISFDLKPTATNPNPVNTGLLTVYSFLTESYQPLVAQVQSSAPGQILSGGNMILNASGALANDKSRIVAGGSLGILGASLSNVAAFVTSNESHAGTSYNWGYAGHDGKSTGHHCNCDFYGFVGSPYAANVAVSVQAAIGTALQNQSPATGNTVPGKNALAAIAAPGSIGGIAPAGAQSAPVNLGIPAASLYHLNPGPGSHILIETDPRFANYRTWLSSEYMQQQLGFDPTVTQKRLGDGFYEQQLIREQIVQLTGGRFLSGFASEETEYLALMNSGITFGKAHNLKPGLALSAAQLAQLTSDIVWLVEQNVTLADGSTQKVLVPQVYLMPRSGDLTNDGTLIAGSAVHIATTGDLMNSGSVAGRDLLQLTADNVKNLGGRLAGHSVSLTALTDIDNIGGRIEARDSLSLNAGRDITLETTTASGTGQTERGSFSRTQIDRVAGLYVTGNQGTLLAAAGRDFTLTAAEVVNAGTGSTTLAAGRDLTLATVTTREQIDIGGNNRNHAHIAASNEVGSQLRTQGKATLVAGNDIQGRAADLQAKGDLTLAAGNDIVLAAGRNEQSVDIASYGSGKSGGGLTSKTVTRELKIEAETSTSRSGTLAGQNISLQAGRDLNLEGGQYRAQDTLALAAERQLTVAAGESSDSHRQSLLVSTKENFLPGKQSLKTTREETTVTPDVARFTGKDVSFQAGGDLTLVAPQIKAETLTATAGGQLTVAAATATHELKETSEFKSNRMNFSEVTAPLKGKDGVMNASGHPDDKTFVTGGRIKDKIKLGESSSERSAVVADIAANSIGLQSGGDTVLVAPRIRAETLAIEAGKANETVNPEAKIQLLGVKESSSSSSSKNSHSFVHETVRDGGKSQETLLLPDIQTGTAGQPTQLALAAPGGLVVGATSLAPTQREQSQTGSSSAKAPAGTPYDLKAQAQTLAQQPGLAWLGELAKRDDVDWQKIELAQQTWDYKHAGLTKEGAAVVTIVVTALTWGWGAELGAAIGGSADGAAAAGTAAAAEGAAAGAGTSLAVNAALNAGLSTLASQAAVSLINNQGDVGKTLNDLGSKDSIKQIVASMLTAGLGQGLTEVLQGAGLIGKLSSDASLATRFANYATKAAVAAGVQSAVFGTPLSETAKTALVNSLAQTLTSEVGDWGKSDSALVAKTLAHAVVQCAAASIQNKDCGSAALGAAVAEVISPLLDKLDDRSKAVGYQQSLGSSIAGMSAMVVASLTGQDALTALNSAQMVDYYNRALHLQENNALKAAAKKLATEATAGRTVTQEQQQQMENYWFDQLESEARAKVDAKAAVTRQNYLDQVSTANQSGYAGGAANYLADAQIARDVVAGLAGAVLYGTDGKPIIADGSELRTFQASNAQYNDSQLLLSNTTSTLIKQFGSQDAVNNAQATQSRWDNLTLAGLRNDRESTLLNAYQQPSEGVAPSVPEAYLIGTGGLAKLLISAAVDAGKAGLGAVGRAGVESAINSKLTLRVPVSTTLPDGTVLIATATPTRILAGDPFNIAIIGRSMDAVNGYAAALRAQGIQPYLFSSSMDAGITVPTIARKEFSFLFDAYGGSIPDTVLPHAKIFQTNEAWAKILKQENYTVIDLGNPFKNPKPSLFYNAEKNIIFGGTN